MLWQPSPKVSTYYLKLSNAFTCFIDMLSLSQYYHPLDTLLLSLASWSSMVSQCNWSLAHTFDSRVTLCLCLIHLAKPKPWFSAALSPLVPAPRVAYSCGEIHNHDELVPLDIYEHETHKGLNSFTKSFSCPLSLSVPYTLQRLFHTLSFP